MNKKPMLISILLALTLAACSGAIAAPSPTSSSVPAQNNAPTVSAQSQSSAPKSNHAAFATKSHDGGSVTVEVTPTALEIGKPIAFEIAMNTHSVDLSGDMTKIVILRDDAGKEYTPTAWEGGEAGGHHRSGTLKFAALTNRPKFVELVIKGLAKVPERVFRWEIL